VQITPQAPQQREQAYLEMVEKRLKMDKLLSTFEIRDFEMSIPFWPLIQVLLYTEGLTPL